MKNIIMILNKYNLIIIQILNNYKRDQKNYQVKVVKHGNQKVIKKQIY